MSDLSTTDGDRPWWLGWQGLSAALAVLLGSITVVAVTLANPGWERLELAVLLGPVWALFALVWLVVLLITAWDGIALRRHWLVTPTVGAVALVMTVAGVTLSNDARGVTAVMSVDGSIEGTTLTVRGTTDLPDGSLVWVGAHHEDLWQIADGNEAITVDGSFATVLDLDRWPNGPISVNASFSLRDDQPPEAIERFGADGEHLSGPGVRWDSDGPYLLATTTIQLETGLAPDDPRALKEPGLLYGAITDESGEAIFEATAGCVALAHDEPRSHDFTFSVGGYYECAVQPGEYQISASAPGYRPRTIMVRVDAGGDVETDIALQPAN